MNKFKNLLLFFVFLFSFRSIFSCAITGRESLASNPSVKLTIKGKNSYLVLCSKATIKPDPSGRTIPHPCASLGEHKIFNKVENGKVYQDLFFQLGVENNRFAMHGFVGPLRKTHLTTKPDISLLQRPIVDEGFLPDEIVKTPFGPRKIKSLVAGDRVTSWDFDKNKWSDSLVIDLKAGVKKGNLIKLKLDNKFVEVEPDQQFYSLSIKKWMAAKDLRVHDVLTLSVDGENLQGFAVEQTSTVPKALDQKTVSLSLDKHHNFVLESGIIVHNKKLWDEKTGGFVDPEHCGPSNSSINLSHGCLPTISGGPSPWTIILNAQLEFQHYPQMLENLRQEEALEKEAQEAHKLLAKLQQEQESFLAAKIKMAQLAAPECNRRARLFQEFQAVVSQGDSPKPIKVKNLDAQESFSLFQQAFVDNPINPGSLKTLESDLFMELHNSLDNAILPESVQSSENGFPMDVFGSAVALSLSVILGLGSLAPMLSMINYCQSISLKLLFHRVIFAELLFFPWPVSYKVDGLFPDQSAVVLQSLGKGFGLKSLLETLKVASSRMAAAPALTGVAKESIKVASATSLISIICPYIIPVALTAVIVKAAVSACQTETGVAAIATTKSFIANLGDKLVETVVNVAQYFGVGPTVAGFVRTDVEKSKEGKTDKHQYITSNPIPERAGQWKEEVQFWESMNPKISNNSPQVLDKSRVLKEKVFDFQDVLNLPDKLKAEFQTKVRKTYHYWIYTNCKARIYKAIQDIESLGIKADCYFYLDLSLGHYGDHIEVFNADGIAHDVRRLDGSKDEFKTQVAHNKIYNNGNARPIEEQTPRKIKDFVRENFCENHGCEDCIKKC